MKNLILHKNKFLLVLIVVASMMLCTLGITSANSFSAEAKTATNTQVYSPTKETPGEMTVINEFKTALLPFGHALYIYGDGWNDDSDGKPVADYDACEEAKTIGVPEIWSNFYASQDSSYDPWNNEQLDFEVNPTCVHWGVDCSGYIGWVLQNITNKPHRFNVEIYSPATSVKFNDALVEATSQSAPTVYNLNDKPDKSIVEDSLTLPMGYKFWGTFYIISNTTGEDLWKSKECNIQIQLQKML